MEPTAAQRRVMIPVRNRAENRIFVHLGIEFVRRRPIVDQAAPRCLIGPQHLASHEQFLDASKADQLEPNDGAAPVRMIKLLAALSLLLRNTRASFGCKSPSKALTLPQSNTLVSPHSLRLKRKGR